MDSKTVYYTGDSKWSEALSERKSYISESAAQAQICLLYTSPSPRDLSTSRMPSSA